jgi:hypothetical protein
MATIKKTAVPGIVAAILLATAQGQAATDDVHIWIRAFIPDSVPGLPNFAEPLPNNPARFVMQASDGGCFSTDQRSWSEELTARARLSSDFHLLVDADSDPVVRPSNQKVHAASAIQLIDCQSGQEQAVNPTTLLADVVGAPLQVDAKTQIAVLAAIPDPQRAWSSATINYDASFTYDRQTRTLDFQATTGIFPAYEAYATLNDGAVVTIFRSGPIRADESTQGAAQSQGRGIEVKGSVNLSGKRPKPPTNLTVQ